MLFHCLLSSSFFDFSFSIDKSDDDISKNIKTGKLFTQKFIVSKVFSVKTSLLTTVARKSCSPQTGFIQSRKLGRKVSTLGRLETDREGQEESGIFSKKLKSQGTSGKKFQYIL